LGVFAYDLDEPSVVAALLTLGEQNRVRIILDNAALHTGTAEKPSPEDAFATAFRARAEDPDTIKRKKFKRYAHDKVFIVSDEQGARTVLTGSTNFSITGVYVNANHVLVFDDRNVADIYSGVFKQSWDTDTDRKAFAESTWGKQPFVWGDAAGPVPVTTATFSPHAGPFADEILQGIVDRIDAEAAVAAPTIGSVFFAVMQISGRGSHRVYDALNELHANRGIFSFGISDAPKGVTLYGVGEQGGVLVTGKPGETALPAPFHQVPGIRFHEIHHKYVVCGFNGNAPTVYCGSSNLAEAANVTTATTCSPSAMPMWPPRLSSKPCSWSTTTTSSTGWPRRRRSHPRSPRPTSRPPRLRPAGTCPRRTAGPTSASTPTTCTAPTAAYSAADSERSSNVSRSAHPRPYVPVNSIDAAQGRSAADSGRLREPFVSPQVVGVAMILVGLTAPVLGWVQHRQKCGHSLRISGATRSRRSSPPCSV
jgi:hypothetical protein